MGISILGIIGKLSELLSKYCELVTEKTNNPTLRETDAIINTEILSPMKNGCDFL